MGIGGETERWTEGRILRALRTRHVPKNNSNGPEWAYAEHVRDAAGLDAKRTIDAVALNLLPSRGMELHGYEVKISKADFRREIKDSAKMDAFAHVLDRFWIVAPKGIVPAEELPATWGLLEVTGDGKIRQKRAATLLHDERVPIPRTFLVPLMRAVGTGLDIAVDEKALEAARIEGHTSGSEYAKAKIEHLEIQLECTLQSSKRYREQLTNLENALDLGIGNYYSHDELIAAITKATKLFLGTDTVTDNVQRSMSHAIGNLERQRALLDRALEKLKDATAAETF